jgi:hypothetical protein
VELRNKLPITVSKCCVLVDFEVFTGVGMEFGLF